MKWADFLSFVMGLRWNEFFVLPRWLGLNGIVLFGFVFLYRGARHYSPLRLSVLLNYERIHVRQWVELWFIGFLLWYLWEALRKPYREIVFEREAFAFEGDMGYLSRRRRYAFRGLF